MSSHELQDINLEQIFDLPSDSPPCKIIKLVMPASTDFFGRVIVYELKLLKE